MVATSESLRVAARDRELSVPIHRPQAHRSAPGAWTTAVLCTGYPPTARGTRWSASAAGNNGRPDCPLVRHRRSRVVPSTRRLRQGVEEGQARGIPGGTCQRRALFRDLRPAPRCSLVSVFGRRRDFHRLPIRRFAPFLVAGGAEQHHLDAPT